MEITKIGETLILGIISRNPEITKRGDAYHKREHKAHQHVYHKRNANSMVANHHNLSRSPTNGSKTMGCYPTNLSRNSTKRGLVSLADKETSHIASLNHKNDRHDHQESVNYTKLVNI